MVILTQYHTEIQNRGISTIGASEIFPVTRMPRFQRFHCTYSFIVRHTIKLFQWEFIGRWNTFVRGCIYSGTSLIRTAMDGQNLFALPGVRINRSNTN